MKLLWKIFGAVFISFAIVIFFICYVTTVRQISDAENHIIEENRIMGSFTLREIEKSYQESRWPFESLRKLSERKDFLFWWVARDDGTIHLADKSSFMGTYAYEYFPQIANVRGENLFLNRNQNYGILVKPFGEQEKKWSFWLGFSLRKLLEIRKEIIFRDTMIFISGLGMLGVIIYFMIMHFTKPIKDLTVGTAAIGKGDLTHRVKIESKDELGQLASSFNKMAEDLQKTTVSRDYVNSIINSMIDTLIVVDQDAKISTINKAACRLLGYKEEELIGRPVETVFVVGEEIPLAGTKLEKLIEEGKINNYETYYKTKDRKKIPIVFSCSVMKNKDADIISIVCTARDVTERKKTEETLIRSERLRALGEMAAGVAHDFNNFLAVILGNAQLLEKGLKRYKMEEIKERLRTIARTASEGGETVRRLQHFTRREVSSQDFTEIDLNEIVREAIASTSPRWKDEAEAKGIRIRIKEELGKLPSILGSRSELMEVLTNLIFNSLEAMKEGGEITISTKAKENEVLLYFTDSGQGIPDTIKNRIFDPFFTTKGSKASGLGLSICYGVIQRHQGKIKVKSIKRKGTTFTISIPAGLEAPLENEKPKDLEKASSRKILVIDDEEGVRDVLGEIFQNEGHRVVLAETSKKGLAKFKQDNFDLVLTDLGMPEISGWELSKRIREIDPDVPVGMITGWGVAATKEKMEEEGVDFILSKPFNYTKVVREVNAVLKSKKR